MLIKTEYEFDIQETIYFLLQRHENSRHDFVKVLEVLKCVSIN